MKAIVQHHGVWFSFYINQEEFVAFVPVEVLNAHCHTPLRNKRSLLAAYKANQDAIESAAKKMFLHGAPRPIRLSIRDVEVDNMAVTSVVLEPVVFGRHHLTKHLSPLKT